MLLPFLWGLGYLAVPFRPPGHPVLDPPPVWLAERQAVRDKYRNFQHEGEDVDVSILGVIFVFGKTQRMTIDGQAYYPIYATPVDYEEKSIFSVSSKVMVGFVPELCASATSSKDTWADIMNELCSILWAKVVEQFHAAIAAEPLPVDVEGEMLFVCPRVLMVIDDVPQRYLGASARPPCVLCQTPVTAQGQEE